MKKIIGKEQKYFLEWVIFVHGEKLNKWDKRTLTNIIQTGVYTGVGITNFLNGLRDVYRNDFIHYKHEAKSAKKHYQNTT